MKLRAGHSSLQGSVSPGDSFVAFQAPPGLAEMTALRPFLPQWLVDKFFVHLGMGISASRWRSRIFRIAKRVVASGIHDFDCRNSSQQGS